MAIVHFIWTILIHELLAAAQGCQLAHRPDDSVNLLTEEDPGTPLFLTPYIESGKIGEAKHLARVPFTENENLGFQSYSGFFTVDKRYNSNQFFWYFPAMNNNADAPVLVWLQGGPGGSSIFGLMEENGPLTVDDNGKIVRREHHWAISHHLIYIDNPVGAGFSFTNDSRGYCTDQTQVGEQLYSTMVQFFQLFPELQQNKFFVSGESYGGKYVPALAYTINKKNPTAQFKINLKGMAIGNGWSDPINQLQYSKYLEQIGLLGWNEVVKVEVQQNKIIRLIRKQKWRKAIEALEELIIGSNNLLTNLTGINTFDNYLKLHNFNIDKYVPVINSSCVRKSIHVGNLQFDNRNQEVWNMLEEDIVKSIAPWISELLEHYHLLVYNGQLDIGSGYPMAVDYLRKLDFSGAAEYNNSVRHVWRVEGEVAGYTRQGGNLIDVMIRNAGHMVPMDQPKKALAMITSFIHNYTVSEVRYT